MDIRDQIVGYVQDLATRTALTRRWLLQQLDMQPSRFYDWQHRLGQPNQHNGQLPKKHWVLPHERTAILDYCKPRLDDGYRRLTFMMLDANIAAVSPSTTYRLLKNAGLLGRWQPSPTLKKCGFEQPLQVHQHWHIDISFVNICSTFCFLICLLDGFSRYIVHHELRTNMTEADVEITVERAREKFPHAKPRIISDNGPQFISKEFKEYLRHCQLEHVFTSPFHPQSNGKLERFHRTIKTEEIRQQSYLSLMDARKQIAQYIEYYNTVRLHSAIHYLTPADVLSGHTARRLQERQGKLAQAKTIREQYFNAKNAKE
jgi:transposase InsO family protein